MPDEVVGVSVEADIDIVVESTEYVVVTVSRIFYDKVP